MRHYRWSVETADQCVCRRILIRVLRENKYREGRLGKGPSSKLLPVTLSDRRNASTSGVSSRL